MARIDRLKRALGGAIKRTEPSRAATLLVERGLVRGRVLDFGCGYGRDADAFGWESYDPYYRPAKPDGSFDTVVCISVLSALSRGNRTKVLEQIRALLAPTGHAYLAVPRNLPVGGRMGMHHSFQNYVVLTLPTIHSDPAVEIYDLTKGAEFDDKTRDFISRRDARRDR